MKKLNQSGALHIALLLGLVLVTVVAFAGYRVMNSSEPVADNTTVSSSSVPESIKTQEDLTQTSKALDDTNAQLDSSLNDDALDSDIDAML
jgi:hypothetical protein